MKKFKITQKDKILTIGAVRKGAKLAKIPWKMCLGFTQANNVLSSVCGPSI